MRDHPGYHTLLFHCGLLAPTHRMNQPKHSSFRALRLKPYVESPGTSQKLGPQPSDDGPTMPATAIQAPASVSADDVAMSVAFWTPEDLSRQPLWEPSLNYSSEVAQDQLPELVRKRQELQLYQQFESRSKQVAPKSVAARLAMLLCTCIYKYEECISMYIYIDIFVHSFIWVYVYILSIHIYIYMSIHTCTS